MSAPTNPKSSAELPPAALLIQKIFAYFDSQVIHVAARLGIADLLDDGPKAAEELAKATRTHVPSLRRLLRALAGLGLLEEVGPGRFALTPLGAPLRTGAPDSVHGEAMMSDELLWLPWGKLLHSVQTGAPAFDEVYGTAFFQYLAQNPACSANFNAAMTDGTRLAAPAILAVYNFSGSGSIVDVGGGNGTLIATILRANPSLRGVLFDLPAGVEGAAALLSAAGVADRCQIIQGDFFQSVPEGHDTCILKSVIHDWDDDHAIAILRNCRRAMPAHGKLLVVEPVLPAVVERSDQVQRMVMADINMLVCAGGRERTEAEFQALFTSADFRLTAVIPAPAPSILSVIEGVPA